MADIEQEARISNPDAGKNSRKKYVMGHYMENEQVWIRARKTRPGLIITFTCDRRTGNRVETAAKKYEYAS